jgi:hypothetical protein
LPKPRATTSIGSPGSIIQAEEEHADRDGVDHRFQRRAGIEAEVRGIELPELDVPMVIAVTWLSPRTGAAHDLGLGYVRTLPVWSSRCSAGSADVPLAGAVVGLTGGSAITDCELRIASVEASEVLRR